MAQEHHGIAASVEALRGAGEVMHRQRLQVETETRPAHSRQQNLGVVVLISEKVAELLRLCSPPPQC